MGARRSGRQGKDASCRLKGMLDYPNFKLNFSAMRRNEYAGGDLATTSGFLHHDDDAPKTKNPIEDKAATVTVFKKSRPTVLKAIGNQHLRVAP